MTGSTDSTQVLIQVDLAQQPIRGNVLHRYGELPFLGWLELAAAIERVRRCGAAADCTREDGEASHDRA
jgi:hypothetical protein